MMGSAMFRLVSDESDGGKSKVKPGNFFASILAAEERSNIRERNVVEGF